MNLRAHRVPGDICADITYCRSNMWNCMECVHFIPEKEQLLFFGGIQKFRGIRRKAQRLQHDRIQFFKNCGSVPVDHSKHTERTPRAIKQKLSPALIQKQEQQMKQQTIEKEYELLRCSPLRLMNTMDNVYAFFYFIVRRKNEIGCFHSLVKKTFGNESNPYNILLVHSRVHNISHSNPATMHHETRSAQFFLFGKPKYCRRIYRMSSDEKQTVRIYSQDFDSNSYRCPLQKSDQVRQLARQGSKLAHPYKAHAR